MSKKPKETQIKKKIQVHYGANSDIHHTSMSIRIVHSLNLSTCIYRTKQNRYNTSLFLSKSGIILSNAKTYLRSHS